jgi:hypothetical protein
VRNEEYEGTTGMEEKNGVDKREILRYYTCSKLTLTMSE